MFLVQQLQNVQHAEYYTASQMTTSQFDNTVSNQYTWHVKIINNVLMYTKLVTFLACITEVAGSNLGWNIDNFYCSLLPPPPLQPLKLNGGHAVA
jgi:hypothetical protein